MAQVRHVVFALLVAIPTALITWILSRWDAPRGTELEPASKPAQLSARDGPKEGPTKTPQADTGPGPGQAASGDARPALLALLSDRLADAKVVSEPSFYDHQTLFDYIDGAAPIFLERKFRLLAAAELLTREGGELTCDVYDMSSPENAASIFEKERPANAKPIGLGDEGIVGKMALVFRKGRYYVKLTAFDDNGEQSLPEVAKALIGRIEG